MSLWPFLAASMLAACGSSSKPASQAVPPLGTIPIITSVDQIVRPIDAYLPTADQISALQRAQSIAYGQCLQSYGLPAMEIHYAGDFSGNSAKTRDRLFGFFDPSTAATSGYYPPIAKGPGAAEITLSPMQRSEVEEVGSGVDSTGKAVTSFNGKPIPEHGCMGASMSAIGGAVPTQLAPALPDGGPPIPSSDPRLNDAYAKWSACMKTRGFKYDTPIAAISDPAFVPKPSSIGIHSTREIATASADVACKQSSNTVGVVVAIESAYDKQYIDSHATALADYEKSIADRFRTAERIIAAGSIGTS